MLFCSFSGVCETKRCVIKQQRDPNQHFRMRWVLPYVKEVLCTCTEVEFLETQTCSRRYRISMPVAKDYFYTDDPMPFVKSESVDKLQMLLECIENTGKFKYLQIAHL